MALVFETPEFCTELTAGPRTGEVNSATTRCGSTPHAGKVVMLSDYANSGSILQVDGWQGFTLTKAIFTGIRILSSTNHQLMQTLGNRTYLNVFGDRIGQLYLSGLAFLDNCGAGGQPGFVGRHLNPGQARLRIGMSNVIEYYKVNRLSNRANPIKVTIDPFTVYECYLHTMQGDLVGEAGTAHRLFQFNFGFAAFEPFVAPFDPNALG